MPGRLHQAANRADGIVRRRMKRLAGLVAEGAGVNEAGYRMGLTKGQIARCWSNIKAELGWQAI